VANANRCRRSSIKRCRDPSWAALRGHKLAPERMVSLVTTRVALRPPPACQSRPAPPRIPERHARPASGGGRNGPHTVGLKPVRAPDPLHGGQRPTAGRRHGASGPVGDGIRRLAREGLLHNGLHFILRDGSRPGRSRLVVQQAVQAFLSKALLPTPYRRRPTPTCLAISSTGRRSSDKSTIRARRMCLSG
jgi:hypothetical protein